MPYLEITIKNHQEKLEGAKYKLLEKVKELHATKKAERIYKALFERYLGYGDIIWNVLYVTII